LQVAVAEKFRIKLIAFRSLLRCW